MCYVSIDSKRTFPFVFKNLLVSLNCAFSSVQSLSRVRLYDPMSCSTPGLPQFSTVQFSSVTQSCLTLCNPMNCSMPGLPVYHQLRVHPNPCPLCQWCHPTISSSVVPFSFCLQSFLLSGSVQMSQLFASGGQSIGSFSFNISPSNEHRGRISFKELVASPCSPRDSQESSPTPQFKSINSSVLSFLHSPTLTSIHDYWKNRGLD